MGVNDKLFDARLPTGILPIRGDPQSVDYSQLYLIPPPTKDVLWLNIAKITRMSLWAVARTAFL